MKQIIAIITAFSIQSINIIAANAQYIYHSTCELASDIDYDVDMDEDHAVKASKILREKGYISIKFDLEKTPFLLLSIHTNKAVLYEIAQTMYPLYHYELPRQYNAETFQISFVEETSKLPECRKLKHGRKISYFG